MAIGKKVKRKFKKLIWSPLDKNGKRLDEREVIFIVNVYKKGNIYTFDLINW